MVYQKKEMKPTKAFVVDDDSSMVDLLVEFLNIKGFDANGSTNPEEIIQSLRDFNADVIIADLNMPGINGLDFMEEIHSISPDAIFIIITGYGTIELAVEAIKRGADQFLTKPFTLESIQFHIERILADKSLRHENINNEINLARAGRHPKFGPLVGKSPSMQQIFNEIVIASKADVPVLISGETGTGKELVAKAIHSNSLRAAFAFVPINCSAIPEGLLESELFGFIKGAFTGASIDKPGLFEEANEGSLFLDELGDMPIHLQAKLLRIIQDGELRRLGSLKPLKTNTRVIASTSHDLTQMVLNGHFRKDLFYRLNVFPIHIPPLRERPEDIHLLASLFTKRFSKKFHKSKKGFSKESINFLKAYRFPGNVRELEHAVERAILLSKDNPNNLIEDKFLKDLFHINNTLNNHNTNKQELIESIAQLDIPLQELKHLYVKAVLGLQHGNISRTAKILGVDRKTLYRRNR